MNKLLKYKEHQVKKNIKWPWTKNNWWMYHIHLILMYNIIRINTIFPPDSFSKVYYFFVLFCNLLYLFWTSDIYPGNTRRWKKLMISKLLIFEKNSKGLFTFYSTTCEIETVKKDSTILLFLSIYFCRNLEIITIFCTEKTNLMC